MAKGTKIALTLAMLASSPAAPLGATTYANPVDIDYRYNFEQQWQGISYRTGADPTIVRHKGAFYLFVTLADGYWRSTDLVHWHFISPSRWPPQGMVAPTAWSDGEKLYIMPSMTTPGTIYVSDAPETGKLDYLIRRMPAMPGMVGPGEDRGELAPGQVPPGPWDPALFRDDDGRWYLYWDSSNAYPLYGIELDPDNHLAYIGQPKPLVALDPRHHGWERFGKDHDGLKDGKPIAPFIEGSWMTKVGGKYYLQYGAPGTEFNVYANGTYVSDHPLGPFTYAPYNPVSYKPGGFVEGAGHGSTVEDLNGNWWNTGTSWIGYNWTFERRVVMFPAHFYPDGQMAVSTRFGDFPQRMPSGKIGDPESLFTGWMLLSYQAKASASSSLAEFAPSNVTDENPRSFWVAARNERGETLTLDLGKPMTARAIQVNFADYKSGRFDDGPEIYTEFTLEGSRDGKHWSKLAATGTPRRDRPNAYFELADPATVRFVRYVHGHVGAKTLAIADLRVFGNSGEADPSVPTLKLARRTSDPRDATVAWTASKGAIGYNVLWGIRPDRLTETYQVFADQLSDPGHPALALHSLDAAQSYSVAIEAFNRNGVSGRTRILQIGKP